MFGLGVLMAQRRWNEVFSRLNPIVFFAIMLTSILVMIWFSVSTVLPYGSMYERYPVYVIVVCLYSALNKRKWHLSKIALSLDNCSLGIYIFHHLLIWAFLFYYPLASRLMNEHYILAPLVLFVIVYFVSWGITYIMKKNKYTNKFIGA